MDIHTDIPLKKYTTMGLGGNARFMTEVRAPEEIASIYHNAKEQSLPIFVLGGGSNVIARDEGFDGIVVRIRIPGFEIVADDINSTTIRIGAGENWDSVVERIVNMHLSGVEAMSAIPGTAGAGPVQNVGAYGQEIADTLQSLEAYDIENDKFITITSPECKFSYRDSIFRNESIGRYVILSITIKLSKKQPQPPFYEALQRYLDEHSINDFTVKTVRSAIIEIRKNKLPDPKIMPNTGSFFKNALIDQQQLDNLRAMNPNIPTYSMKDGKFKVPTGWLIEKAGLKGTLSHGMRVYEKNALVLVNESAASYQDLADARNEIINTVKNKFNITIQQEPLEI